MHTLNGKHKNFHDGKEYSISNRCRGKFPRGFALLPLSIILLLACTKQTLPSSQIYLNEAVVSNSSLMVQQNTHLKWYKDIMTFKEADKNSFPPPNEIVFVGSSSIRLWPHIKSYFPGYPIIQRGFGGAVFGDISNYRTDIITAYKPKQVVIYCGDNDIAAGKKSSQVLQLFTTLFNQIRKENPHARITAISIKPSIVLWSHCSTIENSNRLIKNYLAGQPNTSFVDVYSHMLTWNPKYPRKELYQSDGLHLTLKGYELWAGAVRSDLMK